MLQKMREKAQGTAAKILVGVIIFVLALFGFGAFEAFRTQEPPAATVNGEEISQDALALETERQRQRILGQLGEDAPPEALDPGLLQASVLEGLVNRTLLLQAADDLQLGVSQAQVDRLILTTPQFQTDGRFDADLYQRLIAQNGHNPVSYRRELATSIVLLQLNAAISETGTVTALERRQLASLLSQRRDLAFATFDPKDLADDVRVEDAEATEYYGARLDEFVTEETVDVEYVKLALADLVEDAASEVSEEDVAALYESDRAAFAPQERRHAAHILLETGEGTDGMTRTVAEAEAELRAIKERVQAGESFAEIATAVSEDRGSAAGGGDLGFAGKGVYAPEFESALWALSPGEISDPVRTDFGVHLIQLLAVREDAYPELAEVHDELALRLRKQRAEETFSEQVRELDRLAFESPDGLAALAQTLGLEVETADGVTRDSGSGPFERARVREAAFTEDVLERGLNSPAIEEDGTAVVLRVGTHHPAAQLPFDEVADIVRARLIEEKSRALARSRAEDVQGRLLAGEPVAAVTDDDIAWKVVEDARRQIPDVPPAVLHEAFRLPRPAAEGRSVGIAELPDRAAAVVVVTRVSEGDYSMLSESERRTLDEQLVRRAGNRDLSSLFETVRDDASIKRMVSVAADPA